MSLIFASNKLIESADMSAGFYSDAISLAQKESFSIHAIFTGSPVGSLYVAVTIDGVNWIVLPDSASAVSAAGDVMYNVTIAAYLMARLHYARSSGTGILNAFYSTKE